MKNCTLPGADAIERAVFSMEAAAKAQATRRSRASNNARAAEHHASILAIGGRKQ